MAENKSIFVSRLTNGSGFRNPDGTARLKGWIKIRITLPRQYMETQNFCYSPPTGYPGLANKDEYMATIYQADNVDKAVQQLQAEGLDVEGMVSSSIISVLSSLLSAICSLLSAPHPPSQGVPCGKVQ